VQFHISVLQGGPAKVKPAYIFAGNIILVTFKFIGKIQWFLANVITVSIHTYMRKNLIFNIVHQMAKNH